MRQIIRERRPTRLKGYDYSQAGRYFVTVCTKDRIHWFGDIRNGKMILNESGRIAAEQWKWLGNQYDTVTIDEYCIMPNHLHGIIGIAVGNGRDRSLQPNDRPQPKIKPLPELMGAFKTTSSKLIHRNGLPEFQWQKSYYDRIVRTESSLNTMREYVRNNPLNWETDSENLTKSCLVGGK